MRFNDSDARAGIIVAATRLKLIDTSTRVFKIKVDKENQNAVHEFFSVAVE